MRSALRHRTPRHTERGGNRSKSIAVSPYELHLHHRAGCYQVNLRHELLEASGAAAHAFAAFRRQGPLAVGFSGFGEDIDYPDGDLSADPGLNSAFSYTGGEQDALAEYLGAFHGSQGVGFMMSADEAAERIVY